MAGMHTLFGEETWAKLQDDPAVSALMAQPDMKAKLDDLRRDPKTLATHIADPRMMQIFSALARQSGAGGPSVAASFDAAAARAAPSTSSDAPPAAGDAARPPPPPEEEEDPAAAAKRKSDEAKATGNAAYKARKYDEALAAYTTAVELNADNLAALINRAAVKLDQGDYAAAEADCRAAIEANKERHLRADFKLIARAHGRIGTSRLRAGDLPGAITAFESSLVEFNDPKINEQLLTTRRALKKQEEEAYISPELSAAAREEGNTAFRVKDFPAAIKCYSEAIKRNPTDPVAYSNRAAAYTKLGEFPMAMKDCEACLAIDGKYMKAWSRKGAIHFFMKEYHKCLDVYQQGLAIDPTSKEMRDGLMKTQRAVAERQNEGGVDESTAKAAMQDPEIQSILSDPLINNMLQQMESDPTYAAKAMQDPVIGAKINKLIAAGVLRTG
ncbi:hypothetical protein BU14_0507s0009 [Porphyra umbilicalis]|uniref:STI1 domain-containing protein n=1 Tax=Porphyra umbilicalis TaxID=2786 RepID=A0A1X6NSX5_PORUM|nr:hypothetical protein BU14_0507s0009 [Porphyra umbilicalis]|eukprot:OSX71711.1 hypothetical protein BU14_0507s0009 [Porphyra umbilicalis]